MYNDQIKAVAYGQSYYGLELDTFGELPIVLIISAGGYGTPVTVGTYHSPGTAAAQDPQFVFGFDHRGDSDSEADFIVNAIETGQPPRNPPPYLYFQYPLEYLDLSFTEETWQGVQEFSGRIVYDANPAPEPASFALIGLVLLPAVWIIRRRTDS